MKKGWPIGGFYQLLPSQIGSKELLDRFMMEIVQDRHAFVFIDEIHALMSAIGGEPLFHALQDTGTPRYALQTGDWLDVPASISWLAATTNPGKLDDTAGGALMRRLEPVLRLEAPSVDDITLIIEDQGFPIHPDAAWDAARRCGGLPWMAVQLQKEMKDVATVHGLDQICPTVADMTFQMMGIDELGVTKEDRLVMRALLANPTTLRNGEVVFKMSERALCAATGIDSDFYKERIQPRMYRLGLLTIRGGQCLSEKAVTLYSLVLAEDG